MYSIRERTNKQGESSYQISVKIIGYNGVAVQKAMTWKPTRKLTEKQLQLALKRVATDFEKQVECEFAGREKPIATADTFFNDFAEYWLTTIEKTNAASYYASARNNLDKIKDITAQYRLKDFAPVVIESVYKKIDELRKVEYTVTPKEKLSDMIAGIKRIKKFCQVHDIAYGTLRDARKNNVCIETATKITKALDVEIDEIFVVERRVVQYKSSYIEGMKKVVRCTLALAANLGIIERNYAHRFYVTTKHPDADKVQSMTMDEAQRFMQALAQLDVRKRLALTFTLMTGVRKGELCGLDWSDFDFEKKHVKIVRQYEAVSKKGLILKEPKTKASIREFELSDMLIELLNEYREWYDEKRAEVGEAWQGEDNLFIARNGKRLHPTTIRNWLDEALELAALPHFTVHSLRHTNITVLIASGVSPVAVSGRVGHSKTSTTLNIYAHFLGSSDKEASEIIDNYFGSKRAVAVS